MVRAFYVGILNFLRGQNATTTAIDIKNPFLNQLGTLDSRKAFKQALDALTNEKLIVVNGSYDFLSWRLINGPYPLADKVIEARITPKGVSYEPPPTVVQQPRAAVPNQPLDMPLPAPVKALSSLFKSKDTTEDSLKLTMKKMGAQESHLQFEQVTEVERWRRNQHVSVVANPLTDDSFNAHHPGEPEDSLAEIPLVRKVINPQNAVINKVLKWALIIVSIVLVVLIALIFIGNNN